MAENTPTKRLEKRELGGGVVEIVLGGSWSVRGGLERPGVEGKKAIFLEEGLEFWDSSLISFLVECRDKYEEVDVSGMSEGVRKLYAMSQGSAEVEGMDDKRRSFFYRAGELSLHVYGDLMSMLCFLGEAVLSFGRLITGRGQMRLQDLWYIVQGVGIEALPIVSLISLLVGFIMAFVGAVQLEKFGATVYIADLVGLAMVREMGAMMSGIIMCGRTGAAFAATIGSMKVSEELDALTTTGISRMDFVVMPRIIAMSLMMPLLCIFSNFVGIGGGMLVGVGVMDITFVEYFNQTKAAITMGDFWVGISKSVVFGILVALMGCLRGVQCGSSSMAVGKAATSAVVTGITAVIIADAVFAVLFNVLGI